MTIYGPKKNAAFNAYVRMITYNGGDFLSTPTLAAGDAKVSIDTGALNNLATLPSVSPAASIWVLVALSAAEMNGDVIKVQLIDQTATKEWEDESIVIYTANGPEHAHVDGSVTNASPTTTTLRDSTKSATNDFYNGAVIAFTSGDLIGLARKITDYDGTNKEFTVTALPAAPAQNDTFVILGRI